MFINIDQYFCSDLLFFFPVFPFLKCGPILNAFRCVSTTYMCSHVFLYEETFAAPESKTHQMKIVD